MAKSTHAGLPWLRFIQRLGSRIHFWPFDGWDIPVGLSSIAEVYPALWSRRLIREARGEHQHAAFSIAAWLSHADLPTFRSTGGTVLTPVRVDSNKIAGSIQELVQSLEPVLASSSSKSGLSIDELELKLTVSANGEVGFLASVSAGVEACITLRMKRH